MKEGVMSGSETGIFCREFPPYSHEYNSILIRSTAQRRAEKVRGGGTTAEYGSGLRRCLTGTTALSLLLFILDFRQTFSIPCIMLWYVTILSSHFVRCAHGVCVEDWRVLRDNSASGRTAHVAQLLPA
jgi:hypothetical protein